MNFTINECHAIDLTMTNFISPQRRFFYGPFEIAKAVQTENGIQLTHYFGKDHLHEIVFTVWSNTTITVLIGDDIYGLTVQHNLEKHTHPKNNGDFSRLEQNHD